ncbi:hypothetical protein ENHY17A_200082 [Moraxellaceae bacterium 17A]|nr:hypothetical protein ENHY17A_200082 [Moraxellaceae bacterium 17A]
MSCAAPFAIRLKASDTVKNRLKKQNVSRNPRFNYTFCGRICPPFGYLKLLYLCVKSLRDIKLKSAS